MISIKPVNTATIELNPTITVSNFRKTLESASSSFGKLSTVFQQHLTFAFTNLSEHGNTTLLCVAAGIADSTKGINVKKIEQYIADHVSGVKFTRKETALGVVSYTMKRDEKDEEGIKVIMPTIDWTEYTREKKESIEKTVEQEIESLSKLLANRKLTIEQMERALDGAQVIRLEKHKKAQVKEQADNKKADVEFVVVQLDESGEPTDTIVATCDTWEKACQLGDMLDMVRAMIKQGTEIKAYDIAA